MLELMTGGNGSRPSGLAALLDSTPSLHPPPEYRGREELSSLEIYSRFTCLINVLAEWRG